MVCLSYIQCCTLTSYKHVYMFCYTLCITTGMAVSRISYININDKGTQLVYVSGANYSTSLCSPVNEWFAVLN